ncbi:hypothetical protein ACFL9U_01665 [Thermodesulfobacteriota bacterium]
MAKKDNRKEVHGLSLPGTLPEDLRGKQSVRATFRLSAKAIDAISIVATHLGIKQKSLFDHLIEDTRSLNIIANEFNTTQFRRHDRVQKTYVLSRKTLSSLERTASNFNTPRDFLVEYSILRLLPVITQEQEKHEKRKKLLGVIRKHLGHGRGILEGARMELGENDPVSLELETAVSALENAHQNIADFIQKCKIIEDFNPENLRKILMASKV